MIRGRPVAQAPGDMTGMPAAPPHSPPLTVSPSQKSWTSLLALPTESLLLAGCDERALVVDGRNSYGFPIVDAQPRARLRVPLESRSRYRVTLESSLSHTNVFLTPA